MLVILRGRLVKRAQCLLIDWFVHWLLIASQRLLLNGFIDKRVNYTHLSR